MLTGNVGKKAAKANAAATLKAANMQATNDAYAAQGAAQTQATIAAQQKAATSASELLSKPMQTVDVNLAPDAAEAAVDSSGRRRTTRSQFMASTPSSGIKI